MAKSLPLRIVLLGLCLLGHSPLMANGLTSPEVLIGSTEGFLEYQVEHYLARSNSNARPVIRVPSLDPRLRLPLCDLPLEQSLEQPAVPVGRVTVRVSCPGSAPWSVFVPAQVSLLQEVLALRQPLKRDSIISAGDLQKVEQDIGGLKRGYLTEPEQAIGKKLLRAMNHGQILTPSQLSDPESVKRGEQVVISARSGGIEVRVQGEALAGGSLGQQISVRNLSSRRIIRARITGPGQVQADL